MSDHDEDSPDTIRSCELRRAGDIEKIIAQKAANKKSVQVVDATAMEVAWTRDGHLPPIRQSIARICKIVGPHDTDLAEIRAVSIVAENEYWRWLVQCGLAQPARAKFQPPEPAEIIYLRCLSIANIALATVLLGTHSNSIRRDHVKWCRDMLLTMKGEWNSLPAHSALLALTSTATAISNLVQSKDYITRHEETDTDVLTAIDKLRHIILARTQNP